MRIVPGHLVALITLCVACPMSAATIFIGGNDYQVYKAQLHVHTACSFRGEPGLRGDVVDHAQCTLPYDTVARASDIGLSIVGFSDHAFEISRAEWDGMLPSGSSAAPEIAWLRGFEWSPSNGCHLSIFGTSVPSYVPKDAYWHCPHTAVGRLRTESGRESETSPWPDEWHTVAGNRVNTDSPTEADDGVGRDMLGKLMALAEWTRAGAPPTGSAPVGDLPIVCQINHPSLWSDGVMGDLLGSEQAREAWSGDMCLMEVRSGPLGSGTRMRAGEQHFREALAHGWRVAPTIGIDNQTGVLNNAADAYTGVLLPKGVELTPSTVLQALRSRCTFATEISNLQLGLSLWAQGRSYPPGSVVPQAPHSGVRIEICAHHPTVLRGLVSVQLIEVRRRGAHRETPVELGGGEQWVGSIEEMPDADTVCYYARATHVGSVALSAPIWVEQVPSPTQSVPLSAPIFVLDRSGSMDEMQQKMNQDAEYLATYLFDPVDMGHRGVNKIAVLNFSGMNNAAVDAAFTSDADTIIRAIRHPSIGNTGTALYNALIKAVEEATRSGEKAMIVLMSDGGEHTSQATLEDAIARAAGSSVPCVVVAFRTFDMNEPVLHALADRTMGFYYSAEGFDVRQFVRDHIVFAEIEQKTNIDNVPLPH